jgi:hypothetical protein
VFEWLVAFFLLTAIFVVLVSLATKEADKKKPSEIIQTYGDSSGMAEADEAASVMLPQPRSPKWPALQRNHLKLHPKCEACETTLGLNVHHVKPFHLYPELELDPKNLITLCRDHHFSIGHDPDGPWAPAKPSWTKENPNVRSDAKLWKANLIIQKK